MINIQATGTSISLNITGNANAGPKKGKTVQDEMEEDPFFSTANYEDQPDEDNNNNNNQEDVDELASKVDGVQIQEELFNEDDVPDEDEEEEGKE